MAPQAETIPRASPAAGVQLALYVGAFAGVEAPPAPPAHSYAAEAEGAVLVLTLELAPGTSWTLERPCTSRLKHGSSKPAQAAAKCWCSRSNLSTET